MSLLIAWQLHFDHKTPGKDSVPSGWSQANCLPQSSDQANLMLFVPSGQTFLPVLTLGKDKLIFLKHCWNFHMCSFLNIIQFIQRADVKVDK